MNVNIIVAIAENRAIGKDNDLLWHLPDDMKFFKKTTLGKPVIMGRKNFESIPEKFRPLPGRRNIVITRQPDYRAPGAEVVHNLEDAFDAGADYDEVFVIGGGEIFRQALAMNVVDRMYITEVHQCFDGDVFFPEIDAAKWSRKVLSEHPKDERHGYAFTFTLYTRKDE